MLDLFQLISLAAALLLSVISTAWIGRYVTRHKIMDIPNNRSSHLEPTLRGGGMSIVIVFILLVLLTATNLPMKTLIAIVASGSIVAMVGWLDDHQHLSVSMRLIFHFIAAALSLSLLGLPEVAVGYEVWQPGWFGYLLTAVGLVWCLNFFNFMDGIDGIAAVQTATMTLAAAIILMVTGNTEPFLFYLLLLCVVSIGFLVWNWSPARIFMGDAASGFSGFMLGLFAILTSVEGPMNVWSWVILFGVFGTDATVTLILRCLKKETLHEAHRQHAYQRLAMNLQIVERVRLAPEVARIVAHRVVVLAVAAINLFWLLPLALAAVLMPAWGIIFSAVALLPLIIIVMHTRHIGGQQGMTWNF